ncbi:MAG: SDR family oxidoreductase [Actinobacteria bacterium]|nr:SDR family oxidoreductase [Actinomycetota bacterium]MBU1944206.1 SDR family oxidoreductase [Actinomycetota bacterium]MBU2688401.1 SDR family oxidoreductase [Actinomycetota bacterium]
MSLEGKVALVTGGSGGLGRVHGLVLARMGCDVALTGNRNLEKAEAAAAELEALGRKAIGVKMDVSDPDEVNKGVKEIIDRLGTIDILVNNAAYGIVRATTIIKMDKADWDKDLAINLTGAFNTIKAVMPGMQDKKWGRIVNVSSVTGTMGGFGQCSYAATKAGLIGLTKTVALEGARNNITCNAVVLGVFDGGSFYEVAPEFRERIIKRVAMRRAGDPEELSNVIAFLASPESSFVTGEAIEVSGGISLFTF